MNPRKNGRRPLAALALSLLLLASSCRTTRPPAIPVYIGDGFGGADGREADGAAGYKAPSQLKGWWMTDQASMAQFAAWCYRTDVKTAEAVLESMRKEVQR